MRGKKQLLAQLSAVAGATRLLEALPAKPSLTIVNYHRIGDAGRTPYDSGVFSCSTAEFDWQVGHLQRHYDILPYPQALEIIHGKRTLTRASVLLTFDDGYLDNYTEAFPVLLRHKTSATFFLPTSFIGTGRLPWWDVISYILKRSKKNQIELTYPERASFDLSPAERQRSIAGILTLFKGPAVQDTERFIHQLELACDSLRPSDSERCFLDWDEARHMQASGMFFGSHTHNHEILAKQTYDEQLHELTLSRSILEQQLGGVIDTLAFPVGKANSVSADTNRALADANYATAFSFKGGINLPGHIQPYDVLRRAFDEVDRRLMRLQLASMTFLRREVV